MHQASCLGSVQQAAHAMALSHWMVRQHMVPPAWHTSLRERSRTGTPSTRSQSDAAVLKQLAGAVDSSTMLRLA